MSNRKRTKILCESSFMEPVNVNQLPPLNIPVPSWSINNFVRRVTGLINRNRSLVIYRHCWKEDNTEEWA
jgi:hypothetical protein